MNRSFIVSWLFFFAVISSPASGTVLTSDTVWSGDVSVDEDVLVVEGVTLTILPGTVVTVIPSESTKTDPEYLSPLTEITVRGTLKADGEKESPVSFFSAGEQERAWAGIIVDGGRVMLRSVLISGAETGVEVMKGTLAVTGSRLEGNRYGITVSAKESDVWMDNTRVSGNDYGVMMLGGAAVHGSDNDVSGNRKKDRYTADAKEFGLSLMEYKADQKDTYRVYGDEVLLGLTVWRDRVEVNGIIRLPGNSRLIIMPGTVVEFSRKDTNNDGIGENGLMIQGMVIAKGTKENPIIFRSAEKDRRTGDWDSINIMNSDRAQNLIEHCQIEDAYRGLHFHFSNVAVTGTVVRNNYRGVQFQESIVEIRDSYFYGNRSGLQARDSEIMFSRNVITGNYTGMNVFRNTITLRGNLVVNNSGDGLRVREGIPLAEGNVFSGNRHGLMVTDAVYGTYSGNVITHNLETGLALRNTDNIEVSANAVQGNGLYGMTTQDSRAYIHGNLISDNGERGIGILSFGGIITGNNILRNGLYSLGLDGGGDVRAPENWWGGEDLKETIFDRGDDPSRGNVEYLPVLDGPVLFPWPLDTIATDTWWHGDILISGGITVSPGSLLALSPGTRVLFEDGARLSVEGRIDARGEKERRISFSSRRGEGAGEWDELFLYHARDSVFENCDFRNATWALHVHFTNLRVEGCSFVDNGGGMRFTSGPLEIRNSFFSRNEIGIRSYRGKALIEGNILAENRIGIFVREKGGGLTIRRNNLTANGEYNVRIGDFNDEDVDARNNWWGSEVPGEAIFDDRQEPGIGRVMYEPFERRPLDLTVAPGVAPVDAGDAKGSRREGEEKQ